MQELGGRVEAAEHVHKDLPVAGRLGVDDAAGVGHGGGQGQLTEHVLAGLKRPQDVLGVQPGGQADVDQVDGGVVVDAGHLGVVAKPNCSAKDRSLAGVRPTTTSLTWGWAW